MYTTCMGLYWSLYQQCCHKLNYRHLQYSSSLLHVHATKLLHGCSTNINTNYNLNNYNYTLSYFIRKTALALNNTHSFPSISSCLGVLLVIWLSCHVTGSLTVFELLVIKYKISSVYSPETSRIVQDQSNDASHEIHQIHFYSYENKNIRNCGRNYDNKRRT